MAVCQKLRNYTSRDPPTDVTIIEAVSAVWATPGRFAPLKIGPVYMQEELISAVFGFNNPLIEAVQEACMAFGKGSMISLMLSLGAGRQPAVTTSEMSPKAFQAMMGDISTQYSERFFGHFGVYYRFSYEGIMESEDLGGVVSHAKDYVQGAAVDKCLDHALKVGSYTSPHSLGVICTWSRLLPSLFLTRSRCCCSSTRRRIPDASGCLPSQTARVSIAEWRTPAGFSSYSYSRVFIVDIFTLISPCD